MNNYPAFWLNKKINGRQQRKASPTKGLCMYAGSCSNKEEKRNQSLSAVLKPFTFTLQSRPITLVTRVSTWIFFSSRGMISFFCKILAVGLGIIFTWGASIKYNKCYCCSIISVLHTLIMYTPPEVKAHSLDTSTTGSATHKCGIGGYLECICLNACCQLYSLVKEE